MEKIFGRWSGYEDMRADWFETPWTEEDKAAEKFPDTFPTEEELLFASYGGGSYEGDATMVWRHGGKLYETQGSHCSCYGLEGQFEPEETTVEALAAKGKKEAGSSYYFLSEHDGEAYIAYWKMVEELQKAGAVVQ